MSVMDEHYVTPVGILHPHSLSHEITLTRSREGRWETCDCDGWSRSEAGARTTTTGEVAHLPQGFVFAHERSPPPPESSCSSGV